MPSQTFSATLRGPSAEIVTIEVQVTNGLPGTIVIGLPDSVVRESRDRVKAGIVNRGLPFPRQKILVHLAPAHHKKEGPALDLPIAIGILAEQGVVPKAALARTLFLGELSLDGSLRPVRGLLTCAAAAETAGIDRLVIPAACAKEASWIERPKVAAFEDLSGVVRFLLGQQPANTPPATEFREDNGLPPSRELAHVLGQETAKRALLLAAAGGHNLLFCGPPGSGKTMLARCLPELLPPPSRSELRECLAIQSLLRPIENTATGQRPFRAPHHTISLTGLMGGGPSGRPGEITLAHRGVLFLDELPEFHRDHLEALRQPLEEGRIEIGRARETIVWPADFLFLAAMNPCPCGDLGHPWKPCRCTPHQVQRYRSKISGPILDRIDLRVDLVPVTNEDRENSREGLSTSQARAQVAAARESQRRRFAPEEFPSNARIPSGRLVVHCPLAPQQLAFFRRSLEALGLSQRAHDRCLRVARTIADLEGAEEIAVSHLAEALSYRERSVQEMLR